MFCKDFFFSAFSLSTILMPSTEKTPGQFFLCSGDGTQDFTWFSTNTPKLCP